jgi:hypothetical protein
MDQFPLSLIANVIQQHGTFDKNRGNHKLDGGLASGMCQIRRAEWFGIAGPNTLKSVDIPSVGKVHERLYDVLPLATPAWFDGRVYYCPRRAVLFEENKKVPTRDGVHIHSFRMALTWKYSELAVHRDVSNDNTHPLFSPVVVVSWLVMMGGKLVRIALITYSRKCVAEMAEKIDRYGPAISHMSNFYQRMKHKGRTEVQPSIFRQEYGREGFGQLLAARMKAHMNTCIHFSAMGADALLKINRKYRITQQQAMALIYSVCACNSPDYFRLITNRLMEDHDFAVEFFKKGAPYIAIEVYEMIFEYKEDASRGKHCLPGQRHQPCGNKKGSREAITNSVRNMISKCNDLVCYEERNKSLGCKQDVKQLYLTTLRDFCKPQSKGGVFGAGPLIANKIIQIASLVGLFPFQLLLQSRIAQSTCTYRFLNSQFGLDNVNVDSTILLEALSFVMGTNQLMAEAGNVLQGIPGTQPVS